MITPSSIISLESFGSCSVARTTNPRSLVQIRPRQNFEGDIRLVFDFNSQYVDIVLDDRDVNRDGGFETEILVTLLTDRRASDEDILPDKSGYRGGWWADTIPVVEGYQVGTKLWLLRRSKTLDEIPALAKQYLLEGFQYLIDDGTVEKIEVLVERSGEVLGIQLGFMKPSKEVISYKFYYNWEKQILRRI